MGWLYSESWPSAKAVHAHLIDQLQQSGYTVVDTAATQYGRVFYAVIEKTAVPATMFVALVNGSRRHGWGYKDMDESMGPTVADAPLRLLDKLAPREPNAGNEWANEWRSRVRAFHAQRKLQTEIRKVAKPGDRLWLDYQPETHYVISAVRNNAIIGYRATGEGPYRLPVSHIARHEAVS